MSIRTLLALFFLSLVMASFARADFQFKDNRQEPFPDQWDECSAQGIFSQEKEEVCRYTNSNRYYNGDQGIQLDARLNRIAQEFAEDMANRGYFSHYSPEGRDMRDRLREGGVRYAWAGENIAMGSPTAKTVVRRWMESPGHRRNILTSQFRHLGVGYYQNYWVQVFTD